MKMRLVENHILAKEMSSELNKVIYNRKLNYKIDISQMDYQKNFKKCPAP